MKELFDFSFPMVSSILINTNVKFVPVLNIPFLHVTQYAYAHLSVTPMLENHSLLNYFWEGFKKFILHEELNLGPTICFCRVLLLDDVIFETCNSFYFVCI